MKSQVYSHYCSGNRLPLSVRRKSKLRHESRVTGVGWRGNCQSRMPLGRKHRFLELTGFPLRLRRFCRAMTGAFFSASSVLRQGTQSHSI